MTKGDFTRWMYRGHRPNRLAKAMNRMGAVIASFGITSNLMETLETTGRTSGKTISQPMVITSIDGQRYLVSMLGENVNWVKNVRAAGGNAALRRGSREEVQLEEVAVDQRAPILKAFLKRAPGGRPHIPVDKDAPLADFEKIAADFPVFRIISLKKG